MTMGVRVVMIWTGANGLCGSEVRMRHVRPEVLVSELNGRSRLTAAIGRARKSERRKGGRLLEKGNV